VAIAANQQLNKPLFFNSLTNCPYGPRSAIDTRRSVISMNDAMNHPGNYRIEVSGWGLDNTFFVEKTELLWSEGGGKRVHLHRALPQGTIIFIRLLALESASGSLPVAYGIESAKPMDSNGQSEIRLVQLRPRLKAPLEGVAASYVTEDLARTCEPRESSMQPEPEEILQ
jgi:hypothetical protein